MSDIEDDDVIFDEEVDETNDDEVDDDVDQVDGDEGEDDEANEDDNEDIDKSNWFNLIKKRDQEPVESVMEISRKDDKSSGTWMYMSKYEKTKILGLRSQQLANGSTPLVKVDSSIRNVEDIARMELEQHRLPYIIKRPLANGKYEYCKVGDLLKV